LGEGNIITAAEASLIVKTLKAAGCDEIRPEIPKALNHGVLWLTRVCQVSWCSGRAPKDWNAGVIRQVPCKNMQRNNSTKAG